ncbi:MAG: LruC domain-containing protein [Bacteroidia bacterium]|nr:LruC domain-containing protein [Bacteroidia bacterium]
MKTNFLILLFVFSIFLIACKKNTPVSAPVNKVNLDSNVSSINAMIVPKGFNYKTAESIAVNIATTSTTYGNQMHGIKIFDGNPLSNGSLIASGSCSLSKAYAANIMVPTSVDQLYIVRTAPDNSSVTSIVSALSPIINLTDPGNGPVVLKKSAPASPDCSIGCSSTLTGSQNISLNNSSSVICITGTYSGGIDINHGTVRICGNATIGNCNLNNDAVLLIATGANVTFSGVNINGGSATFKNWSSNVTINSGFSPGGVVFNYGTLAVTGEMNINSAATLTNEGNLTVGSNLNNNYNLINNGSITVSGSFNQNSSATYTNNCRMVINGSASINNAITNNQFIKVVQNTTINSSGILTMVAGAMFKTNNLTINNIINGTGATSLVRVANNTTINSSGRVNGNIQYCDLNGIETNFGTISSSVTQACSLYIPVTFCNTDGNGVLVIPDTDKDGANDNIDQYPTDATQAFNNFYPSEKSLATAAYEDLWPSKGDYDMNDLVMDLRHNIITNAKNEVVKFEGYYRLRAAGGAQKLGFNIKFPLQASNAVKISGAEAESKQEMLVLQLFDDSKKELNGGWNTVIAQAKVAYAEYNVNFFFDKPVSYKEFGAVSEFDPFIWVNEKEKGRGYEIHLPGKTPTDLADASLFTYADDDYQSKEGKYYLTKGNLPWAILTPEQYDYCVELTMLQEEKVTPDITQVYLHFAQWASSGGTYYKDWYKNTSGYRTTKFIYNK